MNVENSQLRYDPYDLWTTRMGVWVKKHYYAGSVLGKLGAACIGLCEWLAPIAIRRLVKVEKRVYPISLAFEISRAYTCGGIDEGQAKEYLEKFKSIAVAGSGQKFWAWGLGFPWMSKNGLYNPDVPFITHTPYVMEALLKLERNKSVSVESREMFLGTWDFLQRLIVMAEDDYSLALSYAPLVEPRIVVNANSYAALSYALHAVYGAESHCSEATLKARKLVCWILKQQNGDGSWFYYADDEPGNFIDCFHSCFVIKNLNKIIELLPELETVVRPAILRAWNYLREHFYDDSSSLCRRFVVQDIKDPYRWDLYDQAEYLGLLIDFSFYDEAQAFSDYVEDKFKCVDTLCCKIDMFGRRWGKGFLRWGGESFLYQQARLNNLIAGCK